MRDAVDGLLGPGQPTMGLVEADAEVGTRPGEADRGETALVQERRTLAQACDVLLPRRHGVGLVEARRRDDGVPEPLDVRLAEHGTCPALVRVAEDRPLHEPAVLRVEEALDGVARPCALGTSVEVGEEFGLGVAGDRDRRAACLDHVIDEREVHGGLHSSESSGACSTRALEMRSR